MAKAPDIIILQGRGSNPGRGEIIFFLQILSFFDYFYAKLSIYNFIYPMRAILD